jgi:hypothetical protein
MHAYMTHDNGTFGHQAVYLQYVYMYTNRGTVTFSMYTCTHSDLQYVYMYTNSGTVSYSMYTCTRTVEQYLTVCIHVHKEWNV